MADYEFFLETLPPEYPIERPLSLWRRSDTGWEYLSLLDWSWHRIEEKQVPEPTPDQLVPIEPARAEQLAADRQFWVRYWAYDDDSPPFGTGEPFTVIRYRSSPDGDLAEAFGRENRWIRDTALFEYQAGGSTGPLREIDLDEAEAILRRIRGVTGATEL